MTNGRAARQRLNRTTRIPEVIPIMLHIDIRLVEAGERIERLLAEAELGHLRRQSRPRRSLRHRLGASLVRLGRHVGGDAMPETTTPAWQG